MMICAHRSEPDFEAECYEAINSQGSDCRTCTADCYRKGWTKLAVTFDNAALVRINHSKVLTISHIAAMKRKNAESKVE
jgi:hypothetical protein